MITKGYWAKGINPAKIDMRTCAIFRKITVPEREKEITMRILGLSFGRKMKNCEIMVKSALMEAEEPAPIWLYPMIDMDIEACTGCGGRGRSLDSGGNGRCIIKDDLPYVIEEFLKADAIIVAAQFTHWVHPASSSKWPIAWDPLASGFPCPRPTSNGLPTAKPATSWLIPRNFKQRYAGLISVGRRVNPGWTSFGLPIMHILCFNPYQGRAMDRRLQHGRHRPPLMMSS